MTADLGSEIVTAFALMLVLQGLQLLLTTTLLRAIWLQLASLSDATLRSIGMIITLVGVGLAWCAVWP